MAAIPLALLTALAYGLSDFVGGIASKTRSAWAVATGASAISGLATLVAALFVGGHPAAIDFLWGFCGGVGEGIGVSFLYRGLSGGRMSVVAPIAGAGSALIPFLVGLISGDSLSPLSLIGVAVAFPALYLVPQRDASTPPPSDGERAGGAFDGVAAGIGFGAQFACVGQIGEGHGLLPLAVLGLAAAAAVIAVALVLSEPWFLHPREARPVAVGGLLTATAMVAFLIATQQGLLAVVSVIAALYPAVTIALAATILGEKIGHRQALGLALTAVAVALITVG